MVGRPPANRKDKPKIPNPVTATKASANEPHHPSRPREPIYVVMVSGIVIGLILLGLFISVTAVAEKVRMSHGYTAILDIVDKGRHAAQTDKQLGLGNKQDLLMVLERLGQITTAGEADGIKVLHNPWGGALVALAMPDNVIRIESIVPTHVCQRFISFLFDQDPHALGLRAIEVKSFQGSWRQTYSEGMQGRLTDRDIAINCGDTEQADVALVFTLRQGG
jgi:hypothetical protein